MELQYADKLHEINSQLDNTYDKQEVDEKVFHMVNMGQDVKEAMSGDSVAVVGENAVDSINIRNKAVIEEKLSKDLLEKVYNGNEGYLISSSLMDIIEIGVNKFNKNTVIKDKYIDPKDGIAKDSVGLYCTDFIKIIGGKNCTMIGFKNYNFAFYDKNKKFIESNYTSENSIPNTFLCPAKAKFIRLTLLGVESVETAMLVYNTFLPEKYYKYEEKIKYEYIPPAKEIEKRIVNLDNTTFYEENIGKNLINLEKCTLNKYIINTNGGLGDWSGAKATDYIEVNAGEKYSFNKAIRNQHFAFYNKDKQFVKSPYTDSNLLPNPFTVPEEAKYVRLTNPTEELPQLEKGEVSTEYEPYSYKLLIKKDVLPQEEKEEILIDIPNKIYALEGDTIKIYFDNLLLNREDYLIDIDCSIGGHYSDRWEANIEHSNAGRTYKLIFSLYDKQAKLLKTKETNIICVAKEKGNGVTRKNLYLGDSTIRAELITKRVLERFEKDSMNIELLGTQHRGDNPLNKYEGRGGWNAEMWCTWYDKDSFYPVNPFINPLTQKFDAQYYMRNNNYDDLDMLVIHLGINDNLKFTSDEEQDSKIKQIIEYYNEIITSFKKYKSSIKIAIGVTIPPNQSQDSFVATYKCGQNQWRYKRNNIRWVDRLINEFKDRENENIYLVPINVVLDTKNNLKDHVHCLEEGYNQIADEYFCFTKYLA